MLVLGVAAAPLLFSAGEARAKLSEVILQRSQKLSFFMCHVGCGENETPRSVDLDGTLNE